MDKEKTYKNKIKSPSKPKMLKRSLARLMAVQIMYQKDFLQIDDLAKIKSEIIEDYLVDCQQDLKSYKTEIDEAFLDKLLAGILLVLDKIDAKIAQNLKEGRNIGEIDKTLLQILRFGVYELNYLKDVPAKVVVDEYVSIAASFFDKKKVTFANAILDKIAQLRDI